MLKHPSRHWQTLLPLSLAIAAAMPAFASGGGGDSVLVSTSHVRPEPDAMQGYVHGHLGVLWPSYERDALMIAYRQINGLKSLSKEDEALYLEPPKPAATPPTTGEATAPAGIDAWIAARKQLGLPEPAYPLSTGWRDTGNYSGVENCQYDAFEMAAKTLASRQHDHAGDVDALRQWAAGQDSVFSNCDQKTQSMPPLPAKAPAWLVKDRDYQLAAALLYQGKLDEAAAAFDKIAADKASPWQAWADYLAVRAWWRAHFKGPDDYKQFNEHEVDWAKTTQGARLKRIAEKSPDPAVAEAAQGLFDAMEARAAPKSAYATHWRLMDGKDPVPELGAWVAAERWFWALLPGDAYQGSWLYATRSLSSDGADGSAVLANWRSTHSHAWLAGAMMAVGPDAPGVDELVAATQKAKPGDPLYVHYAYHRIRLSLARHDQAGARAELARMADALKDEALGTRQAFDQLAMLAAPSLKEVVHHLVRKPVGHDNSDWDNGDSFDPQVADKERGDFLDSDTCAWLATQLTPSELLQLAREAALPANVREQLAGEAWHAAAFGGDAVVEQAATQLWAELTNSKPVASAAKAAKPDEARFLMARALLLGEIRRVHDGYHPYAFGARTPAAGFDAHGHWTAAPAFHDAAAASAQTALQAKLDKANETTWMGQQILPWMRAQPKFAEGPAILEKLVYASRYRQQDTPTSRSAFQLLHKQYPNSPEAERTRYFY